MTFIFFFFLNHFVFDICLGKYLFRQENLEEKENKLPTFGQFPLF